MIIVSEIGDKTFLIAAILAMRHPRIVVFAGALGSLVVMSILSAAMGHILPTLIPKRWTQLAAGVLFIVFGAKLFREERTCPMREAEEEINEDVAEHDGTGRVTANGDVIPLEEIEAGHNVYIVAFGTIVGHTFCTALAVIAGRYVSTKISAKHITLGGAALFLCFGLIYLYEASQVADFDPLDHIPRG
ncbi:hypothetical protein BJV74DRAFT_877054 [Russula compacta]|nr:hypothetical protein BJV74DRAFT_877054 [Russula compacta]